MNQLSEEQQERVKQELKRRLTIARGIEIESGSAKDRAFVDGGIAAFELLLDDLSLLDSDSQAAAHGPSSLLRRLKDFLFENCDHSDRDRNYDWCPSCVMGFMEVVAQPSNADPATAMHDKCVEKVEEMRAVIIKRNRDRDESNRLDSYRINLLDSVIAQLQSLTLDAVKPGEM